jgi:hypothetical protein
MYTLADGTNAAVVALWCLVGHPVPCPGYDAVDVTYHMS